ncbi:ChbG/HpnK family deacetylase [Paracidobacterium acidisoli]|uniref:ChbG/HpnK family deacetylase n=1 Tax=Paracidobacterium acidisoli TaxID=2303751 RepID=A0A372IRI8_9BACT|nr:ChbG/HpnK family deacetylase [Paracidobacterium acidisoli]MBT9330411.1 ChbG/HpnK family deacetylase [Paracidobacterium acidisoli]
MSVGKQHAHCPYHLGAIASHKGITRRFAVHSFARSRTRSRLDLVTRLILNADDFGLTTGVNRSIVELHRAGALTSATLMATAASFTEAAAQSAALKTLGTGCHVVLVDGFPALPASEIPTLAPGGSLRPTLGGFVRDLFLGRIREAEIEHEAVAQIRRLQQSGVQVTHLDTHKHTHMFPRVLRPLLRAALQCGVHAVRNPFEPEWALAATPGAPFVRRMEVRALRTQQKTFRRLVREAGLATPDGAIGVLATGTLDATTLRSLLRALPSGDQVWELVCHPGYTDAELDRVRTRLRASRNTEHAALLEVIPGAAKIELIHFGHLHPAL